MTVGLVDYSSKSQEDNCSNPTEGIMSSPQGKKWLSYFDKLLLHEVGMGQPSNPFFWCTEGINHLPNVKY